MVLDTHQHRIWPIPGIFSRLTHQYHGMCMKTHPEIISNIFGTRHDGFSVVAELSWCGHAGTFALDLLQLLKRHTAIITLICCRVPPSTPVMQDASTLPLRSAH